MLVALIFYLPPQWQALDSDVSTPLPK